LISEENQPCYTSLLEPKTIKLVRYYPTFTFVLALGSG